MGEGENALMYSLNFTTQESFRNQVCKISQSYKGQPSEIVEKILRDKNYLDSTRKLFVEETAKPCQSGVPKYATIYGTCSFVQNIKFKTV